MPTTNTPKHLHNAPNLVYIAYTTDISSKGRAMATSSFNIRMDENLKRDVDEISKNIGLSTAAVFNVFARQFVAHRGFPFDVVAPTPSEPEFAREMDARYRTMLDGSYTEHDLSEA